MAYSNYLVHLLTSYYFRFHIPFKLQEVVGKKEIRYSLRCRTLSEAKPKARLIAGKIQQLFENGRIMELSKQQIQDLISKYVKESLKAGENSRLERNTPLSPGDLDHLLESIEVLRDGRKEDFARCDYSSIMDSVDNLLQDAGIKLDKGSRGYNILARELLKAEIKLFEIEHKRTLGD